MAEKFDATGRLADGLPSVTDIQSYVSASHALGYQHPDLTTHAAQVRDRYASEDGMNLNALDADCVALQAAAAATDDALARQDAEHAALAAAWQGGGAHASREFLRRHGEASAHAAAAVRTTANALADLRDRLWQAVDGKVATVLAIDDSVQARRADWLAASHTVNGGAGDRAVASELVDQEVKPFVDNVIGGQWLSAMHAAVEAIEAAYEAATAELASEPNAAFDVPGDLGPTWTPAADHAVATAAPTGVVAAETPSAVPVAPAGWSPPAASAPLPVASAPPAGTPVMSAPPAWAPAASAAPAPTVGSAPSAPMPAPAAPPADPAMSPAMAAPSMPSLGGGGLPDIGGGRSGFGQQLGDLVGRLLGDGDAGHDPPEIDDPADIDDVDVEEPDEIDDKPDDVVEDAELDTEEAELEGVEATPVEPAADVTCAAEPPAPEPVDAPPEEPAATPPPEPLGCPPEPLAAPPPPEPLAVPPPADPSTDSGTPCEIAGDELPQVGE